MPKYIFSLGLIPVQEFIAEARRSRDLRAGSAMLSWFMRKTLIYLREKHHAEILLPHKDCLNSGDPPFPEIMDEVAYSLPNRASGHFDADTTREVFQNLPQLCLQTNWETLFHEFYEKRDYSQKNMGGYRQIFIDAFHGSQCPIDLIWVAAPYDAKVDEAANLEKVDQLYANVKRTRPIREWHGKSVGKCDQCGRREAVGASDDYDKWWKWQKSLRDQQWVKSGARLDAGERLCTVCFAKRFAGYAGTREFPSTSGVAARQWAQQLSNCADLNVRTAFTRYADLLKRFEDGDSLYYKRGFEKKREDDEIKALLLPLQKARQELAEAIRKKPELNLKPEPSNYLAVLTFDGDGMGKKSKDYFAKDLPKQLLEFSHAARTQIMPLKLAEIFYIGGDEGLILTPIEYALSMALKVRELFISHMQKIADDITLSMGLAIFDRERPLGNAIRLAHHALLAFHELGIRSRSLFANFAARTLGRGRILQSRAQRDQTSHVSQAGSSRK